MSLSEKAEEYLRELDQMNADMNHAEAENARLSHALTREQNARQAQALAYEAEIRVLREQLAESQYNRDFFHAEAGEFMNSLSTVETIIGKVFEHVHEVADRYKANAANLAARQHAQGQADQPQGQSDQPQGQHQAAAEGQAEPQPEAAPAIPETPGPRPDGAGTVDDGAPAPSFLTDKPQAGT